MITPAVGNSFRVSALVPGLITFLEACELFLPWDKLSDAEGGYNTVGRPFTKPNPQTSPDLERDLRAETPVENPSNPEPDESDVQPQNTERMLAVFFGLCGVLASVYLALELPGVTHTAIIPLELTMYALLLMAFLGLCGCLLVVVRKPDLAGFLFLLLYTIPVGLWRDSLFLVFPAGFAVAGGLSLFLVSSESKARSETDSTQDTPPPADRKSRRSQQ
ncbi:MAG: hypothetical protein K8U57_22160 [Planctomycetes bacterium]|nr:hypothetical protein [Planctomycetota bacterium]